MENVEMIEKLMEKADVTYEEAKGVLDAVNWNLLDALIALEKEGKIKEEEPAVYSTKQDISTEAENIRKNNSEEDSFKGVMRKICSWFRMIISKGMDNKLCVTDNKDKEWFSIPITIAALFLIGAFWPGVVILCIAFFSGCTFSFEGPDLGNEKYNSFMSKIKFTSGKSKEKNTNESELNDKK